MTERRLASYAGRRSSEPMPKKTPKESARTAEPSAPRDVRDELHVEPIDIDRVKPYAKNPRNNAAAIDKVAASLQEFGWRQPIVVDEDLTVIAGHSRLAAAKKLGLVKVPVHVALGLSVEQVRAYRLADNRVAEESEWNQALLSEELEALLSDGFDLTLTGFDAETLKALTGEIPDVEFEEFDESAADNVRYVDCPKCNHHFPV